jgi:hypothetical protein
MTMITATTIKSSIKVKPADPLLFTLLADLFFEVFI